MDEGFDGIGEIYNDGSESEGSLSPSSTPLIRRRNNFSVENAVEDYDDDPGIVEAFLLEDRSCPPQPASDDDDAVSVVVVDPEMSVDSNKSTARLRGGGGLDRLVRMPFFRSMRRLRRRIRRRFLRKGSNGSLSDDSDEDDEDDRPPPPMITITEDGEAIIQRPSAKAKSGGGAGAGGKNKKRRR